MQPLNAPTGLKARPLDARQTRFAPASCSLAQSKSKQHRLISPFRLPFANLLLPSSIFTQTYHFPSRTTLQPTIAPRSHRPYQIKRLYDFVDKQERNRSSFLSRVSKSTCHSSVPRAQLFYHHHVYRLSSRGSGDEQPRKVHGQVRIRNHIRVPRAASKRYVLPISFIVTAKTNRADILQTLSGS